MKHFDIIHCIDENYAPQCGVTITSFCLNHMDVDITFHIMFANLSNSTKHKLVKQAESYGKSVKLYQIDIKELDNSPLGGGKELPIAAYFRLLATDYLPKDIHRALYLDVDIVVCKSLTDFYNTDLTNWPVAGVYDISTLDEAPSKRLDYDFKLGYINSGIMLINVDYWRKNNIKQKCLDFLEAYRDKLMFHDQDVLNGSLAGSIKIMPLEYNVQKHFYDPGFEKNMPANFTQNFNDTLNKPAIIHFTESEKPWSTYSTHPMCKQWWYYAKRSLWKRSFPILPKNANLQMKLRWLLIHLGFPIQSISLHR